MSVYFTLIINYYAPYAVSPDVFKSRLLFKISFRFYYSHIGYQMYVFVHYWSKNISNECYSYLLHLNYNATNYSVWVDTYNSYSFIAFIIHLIQSFFLLNTLTNGNINFIFNIINHMVNYVIIRNIRHFVVYCVIL